VSCANLVLAADDTAVTATDNCGGTVTITHDADVLSGQTCANRYTITRTYHATDVCGNVTSQSQTITVDDQTAPLITYYQLQSVLRSVDGMAPITEVAAMIEQVLAGKAAAARPKPAANEAADTSTAKKVPGKIAAKKASGKPATAKKAAGRPAAKKAVGKPAAKRARPATRIGKKSKVPPAGRRGSAQARAKKPARNAPRGAARKTKAGSRKR